MEKSSVARSGESSWSGGERNGSFGGEMRNVGSSGRGQEPPASTLGIAIDNVKSTPTEDVTEERGSIASTKQNDRTSFSSTSSSSSSSNSSIGGKLLQVLKRKVHVSSGVSKASSDDRPSAHHAKEGSRRTTGRSHDEVIVPAFRGQSSVDKLEGELLILRRKLEKREAEMQRLTNEVSTLRAVTTTGSGVEPQSQSQALSVQAQEETSPLVNHSDSFRSDTSQLSCLDFSFASSGNIKFEGKIKTKITPKSSERVEESGGQTVSILSDAAAVGAPRLVEKLSKVNGGSILKEVRMTTAGSPSSHVQEMEIVDKYVEVANKSLDETKAEISKPDYVEKYGHKHIGGDFKSPETVKDPEDAFSDLHASRSPPSSASSSSSEEQDFTFPYLGPWTSSDSHESFEAEEPVLWKETNGMISCAPAVVEVDEKSILVEIGDCEEMNEKSLKVPFNNQTEDSREDPLKQVASSKAASFSKEHNLTIQIPPPTHDPLKVLMSSCVMHELDKFSKTMESLKREESLTSSKYPDHISTSTSVLTPPHSVVPADQALPLGGTQVRPHSPHRISRSTSVLTPLHSVPADQALPLGGTQIRRHSPHRISSSTSVLTPPHSVVPADQALPLGGTQVRRHYPKWAMKERNVLEQPRRAKPSWNKNARDLESVVSTISKSGGPTEPIADQNRFGVENLPPPKSQGSNIYGTTSFTNSQSREYTVRTTAGDHESLSPSSSSIPPSARELSPSRNSPRRQLTFDGPPGWKPDSGSGNRVWQTVSSDVSEEKYAEEIDLEEEVRQCLEQSRMLLMSDASDSVVEHGTPGPISQETSFSVLAVSRHRRRSMEKSKPSPRGSSERLDRHEQHATFHNVDRKTMNTQSGKVDVNELRALTEQESNPGSTTNAVEGYDKKHAQPRCESGSRDSNRDSNLRSLSSLPSRRSRFFIEANSTRFSQVA